LAPECGVQTSQIVWRFTHRVVGGLKVGHTTIRNLFVLGAMAALVLPGCIAQGKYYELEDELVTTQEELAYTQEQLAEAEGLLQGAEGQQQDLANAEARALAAEEEAVAMRDQMASMRGESALLSGKGVEIIYNEETGEAGYRAEGDVVFVSGSDALTKEGKAALDLVVPRLIDIGKPIRVEGHTDSDPVKKSKARYPRGNIQLGAQRAMSVRAYLIEKGLGEDMVSIASYGAHRPVLSGTSADAKRANRRVEIMVGRERSSGSGSVAQN